MYRSSRFPTRSGWLHTVQGGNPGAPALLCVHGASGNWTNYRPLLRFFQHDRAIYSLDLRGHGRSPWPGPGTLDDIYADLESYAATLPRPFDVLAHSFGGYLGVRLSAERPDWVRHLTLLNSASSIPQGLAYRFLRRLAPWAGWLARPEGIISTGAEMTALLMDRILPAWDCRPYYAAVSCPRLTVLGGLDPMIPLAHGRASAALLDSPLRVLPLGMHVSMWECPGRLAAWIRTNADLPGGPGRPA